MPTDDPALLRPRVALATGADRYAAVRASIALVEEEFATAVQGKRSVVIKPNFVNAFRTLAMTKADTVRAILDALLVHHPGPFLLVEASSGGPTELAIMRLGYRDLMKRYPLRFLNVNHDETVTIQGYDRNFGPLDLPVSRTLLEADCLISAAVLKTHDTVLATMSLKNVAVGAIPRFRTRRTIHQGHKAINLTLSAISERIRTHFAVVDGWQAMEGNGPSEGTPVDMRLCLSGSDPVAVDSIGAHLMGFDIAEIGYLQYCAQAGVGVCDIDLIETVGEDPANHRRAFRRHDHWEKQLDWVLSDEERARVFG